MLHSLEETLFDCFISQAVKISLVSFLNLERVCVLCTLLKMRLHYSQLSFYYLQVRRQSEEVILFFQINLLVIFREYEIPPEYFLPLSQNIGLFLQSNIVSSVPIVCRFCYWKPDFIAYFGNPDSQIDVWGEEWHGTDVLFRGLLKLVDSTALFLHFKAF